MTLLAQWDCSTAAATLSDGVTAEDLTFGAGVSADPFTGYTGLPAGFFGIACDNSLTGTTYATYAYATHDCYVDVTVTIPDGTSVDFTDLTMTYERGGTSGTRGFAVRTSADSYATEEFAVADISTTYTRPQTTTSVVDLSNLTGVTGSLTMRIYVWTPFTNSTVEWTDLSVNGTAATTANAASVDLPAIIAAAGGGVDAPFTTFQGTLAQWEWNGDLQPNDTSATGITPGAATFGADVRQDAGWTPLNWSSDTNQPWIGQAQPGVIAVAPDSGHAGETITTYTNQNVYFDLPITVAAGYTATITDVQFQVTRGHWSTNTGLALRNSTDSYATEDGAVTLLSSPATFSTQVMQTDISGTDTTVTLRVYVWTPYFNNAVVFDSVQVNGSVITGDPGGGGGGGTVTEPAGVTLMLDNTADGIAEPFPAAITLMQGGAEVAADVSVMVSGTETAVPNAANPVDPATLTITTTATTGQVALSWTTVTGASDYVATREGTDSSGVQTETTTTASTSATFTGLVGGRSYKFTVQARDGSGNVIVEAVAYDSPPFTTTPSPSGMLENRSGLPWNSTLYPVNGSLASKRSAFESWIGHPMDGLMYFATRQSWTTMDNFDSDWINGKGYRVISIPTQPKGQNNSETASGARNSWWETWGGLLTSRGVNSNRTIVRLNWEANAGAWYDWTWDKPSVQSFVQAFTNVVVNVRKKAPDVMFNLNHARGNWSVSAAGGRYWWECVDLLKNKTDNNGNPILNIVGSDSYNHSPGVQSDGPTTTDAKMLSNWRTQTNGQNTADPPSYGIPCRGTIYKYAADNGLWFWHDEWGPSHSKWNSGGDDPVYMQWMYDWFAERAVGNGGWILGETIFNGDGAPDTNHHTLYEFDKGAIDPVNQLGALKYLELWGNPSLAWG